MTFPERYGPWAIIAGASEGTGRAFAHKIAAQGLNCILIARREEPLAVLAEDIHSRSGLECLTVSVDLSCHDAFEHIVAAVGSREVGLFVSNAGADPNGAHFLNRDIDAWMEQINRHGEAFGSIQPGPSV